MDIHIGLKKDYLTIISRYSGIEGSKKRTFINCMCHCGKIRSLTYNDFKKNKSGIMSCGCMRKNGFIDGRKNMPEWRIYNGIKYRCNNPNCKSFKYYGGRGIKVCDRWMTDFKFFIQDMGLRKNKKLSIDRIDNNGNYEPGNCRWATMTQQNNNKRNNKKNNPTV